MDNFTNQEIKETENTGLSNFTNQVEGTDNDKKGLILIVGASVAATMAVVAVGSKIKKSIRKKLLAALAEEEKAVKPPVVEVEAEVVEVVEEPIKKEPVKKK